MTQEHLQPTYGKREFYGPLQLDPDIRQPDDRNFMIHPDDPTKLVRFNKGFVAGREQLHDEVAGTQRVLEGLSRYGIPHVNPVYMSEETAYRWEPADLIIVVDRLDNVRPYSEILGGENIPLEVVQEVDQLLCRLLGYVGEVLQQGGYIDTEMIRLDQFAYDASRPVGQKMILVDVEPIGSGPVDPAKESIREGISEDVYPAGYPTKGAQTTARMIVDIIELARATDYPLESSQVAAHVAQMLPGDSLQTNEAKAVLLHALDTNEVSQAVFNLAISEKMDCEEWLYNDEDDPDEW